MSIKSWMMRRSWASFPPDPDWGGGDGEGAACMTGADALGGMAQEDWVLKRRFELEGELWTCAR